jgi:hypothetical protein
MPDSAAEGKLDSILDTLDTYVRVNYIEPHNKKNDFRTNNIRTLEIYDEIVKDQNPLEMLYNFFTPSNINEILDDIKLEKQSIDCFTARTAYNLIEKTYIASWIRGIRLHHKGNYKYMAYGAYTIRAVMRVVIRELIRNRSGPDRRVILDDIVDTIGDCNSSAAYLRDTNEYRGDSICINNNRNYQDNRKSFLAQYNPSKDNCPDIQGLLGRRGLSDETSAHDPRWISIVESATRTSALHNFGANVIGTAITASDTVDKFSKSLRRFIGYPTTPEEPTPKKKSYNGKSKGRLIISRLKKKGGRKTIKHKHTKNKNSRKYK